MQIAIKLLPLKFVEKVYLSQITKVCQRARKETRVFPYFVYFVKPLQCHYRLARRSIQFFSKARENDIYFRNKTKKSPDEILNGRSVFVRHRAIDCISNARVFIRQTDSAH